VDVPGGWHQDGSFLGDAVATIDVWIALSDCGRDAPGLDIVPHRFDHLLPPGPDGVVIPSDTLAAEIEPLGVGILSPTFRAGDALLFDQRFLHRTAVSPQMTRERHALETWLFAPSRYPFSQVPLLY
jgi:ectoine hydroxylase-related dioxygenase (phytanoyl-CoA dioxygenase family)